MNKLSTSTLALAFLARNTQSYKRLTFTATLLLSALSASAGPFIYVANTGEDTVSKIDVSNNTEVARYATWFTPGSANHVAPRSHLTTGTLGTQDGPCPSRIAKDPANNVYVLDRFFKDASSKLHLPVLLKIAASGGSPTSTGSTALPITDGSNPNHIDPAETTDKLIVWAQEIGNPAPGTGSNPTDEGALGRALCVDTTGNLWVGMYGTRRYYKVNPTTGAVIGGPVDTPGHTPYGCQVDTNGTLWSVDAKVSLAEIDTNTGKFVKLHNHGANGTNYSLSIFNDCTATPTKVTVYLSNVSGTYIAYDPKADAFTNPPAPPAPAFISYSVGVDSKGNIFSGHLNGRVIKSSPTGALLWDTNTSGPTQSTANLHGLIVDDNDDVWVVHLPEDRLVKYTGANLQYVAPTVKVGIMPYTYGNTPPATCTSSPPPSPSPTVSPPPTPPPGCAQVTDKDVLCDPNGGYNYTFTVTNNTSGDMLQILLTPLPGSAFTLSKELFNLPSPLHNAQSITLTVNIGNVKAGDNVCFFVSLMADKTPCCTIKVCPKLPKCANTTYSTTPSRPPPPVKKRR